ncbi:sigma-B regulation protein RsbU (phosphoserine phosphatase) [Alkalibacillus filiformis]|uniref:Sigma-B regulation protein RsbU (Phosphoserine phosphatase) n=1 Tax=Alkalibacillus filiformis TaxID=200990 RepID=A0ABU0DWJ4_9BACI|nr:PP2C family protein-serine/threonine phosphatase [Alkalibacillus filiformis]MDQ0352525.1 sigma-B regulation protein RsbU (phosphoserine phosphatase) [Alkalibacillus filiformis]
MYRRHFSLENDGSANDRETKTLEREIKLARNIQTQLLNGHEPTVENSSVTGLSIPARLIGGDYYDFYVLPNGKLRIIIGDVMGKGIPAAMLMILTRGAFRSAAESTKGPGETLTAMNSAMYEDLRKLSSFVTVLCADWDPATKELTYANAGHTLPIIVHPENLLGDPPKAKGVMLGGLPNTVYKEESLYLKEEDLVCFYTDGITEAQNKAGELYRLDRLNDCLLSNCNQGIDVKDIEECITRSISEFTGDCAQRDDITMVLLKVNHDQTDITSYNSPVI